MINRAHLGVFGQSIGRTRDEKSCCKSTIRESTVSIMRSIFSARIKVGGVGGQVSKRGNSVTPVL